ncbi:hypothetical protein V6Z12_A06G037500 [Gossypium hirsutum]
MSKSSDRSAGREKRLTEIPAAKQADLRNNSNHTVYIITTSLVPYLSNKARIKGFGSSLRITRKGLIPKVIQMMSSNQPVTSIVSRTTNSKNTIILTRLTNLEQ